MFEDTALQITTIITYLILFKELVLTLNLARNKSLFDKIVDLEVLFEDRETFLMKNNLNEAQEILNSHLYNTAYGTIALWGAMHVILKVQNEDKLSTFSLVQIIASMTFLAARLIHIYSFDPENDYTRSPAWCIAVLSIFVISGNCVTASFSLEYD